MDWWGMEWGGRTSPFPPRIYGQKAIWSWGRVIQRLQVSARRCSHSHSCVRGSGNYQELMESRFSGLPCFIVPQVPLGELDSRTCQTSKPEMARFCLLSSRKADVKLQGSIQNFVSVECARGRLELVMRSCAP